MVIQISKVLERLSSEHASVAVRMERRASPPPLPTKIRHIHMDVPARELFSAGTSCPAAYP